MNSNDKNGKFKKGTSGNPAGRPLGSRNQATLAYEQMMHDAGPQLMRTVVEQALNGDRPSQRLCLDRIYAAPKQAPIEFSLQPIESIADLPRAFREVTTAMSEGRITPDEAVSTANVLMIQADVLKTVDLEQRVREIEKVAPDVIRYHRELHEHIGNEVKLRKAEAAEQAADDEEEAPKR
jgi:hypothetical protein